MICPHTQRVVKRGLCFTCYRDEDIRVLYPFKNSKHNARGLNATDEAPTPPFPTSYPAGSLEKMRVMHERIKLGFAPHHPDDSKAQYTGLRPFEGMSWRAGEPTGLEYPCSDSSEAC